MILNLAFKYMSWKIPARSGVPKSKRMTLSYSLGVGFSLYPSKIGSIYSVEPIVSENMSTLRTLNFSIKKSLNTVVLQIASASGLRCVIKHMLFKFLSFLSLL